MQRRRRVGAVVLGAGAASRMGRSKLTMPYGESTVIGTVLARLSNSSVDDVVLVTGHHAEEIEAEVAEAVATVRNPNPDRGNLSSLRCGAAALGNTFEGVVVILGDMPGVDPVVLDRVVEAFASSSVDAVIPMYSDGAGHPLVVSLALVEDSDVSLDQPLWQAIEYLPNNRKTEVVVGQAKPLDINTPKDHSEATTRSTPGS